MKFVRISVYLLFLILAFSSLPSFSNCGDPSNNPDLDKECNATQCNGKEDDLKGCYLPPDGSKCPLDYPNKKDICCCK